jgi:hypothetical protein
MDESQGVDVKRMTLKSFTTTFCYFIFVGQSMSINWMTY